MSVPEPAMISFEPTDDQKMVRDSVAQFAERTLRPRIREFERGRCRILCQREGCN